MIIVFCLVTVIAILSTIFWSGLEGLLVPYQFRLSRDMDQPSLMIINHSFYSIIDTFKIMDLDLYHEMFRIYVLRAAFLLQFSIVPLCLTSKIETFEKVVKWSALSILVFILFAKINSPQWLLWVSPLLILIARDRKYIVGIILLDLLTYIQFPITFNLYIESYISSGLTLFLYSLRIILLIAFAAHIFSQVIKDNYIYVNLRGRFLSG
jgi:hypothetical protein